MADSVERCRAKLATSRAGKCTHEHTQRHNNRSGKMRIRRKKGQDLDSFDHRKKDVIACLF